MVMTPIFRKLAFSLSNLALVLTLLIALTGGFIFKNFSHAVIDLSQVNAFAWIALIFWVASAKNSSTQLNRFLDFLTANRTAKTALFSLFFLTLAFGFIHWLRHLSFQTSWVDHGVLAQVLSCFKLPTLADASHFLDQDKPLAHWLEVLLEYLLEYLKEAFRSDTSPGGTFLSDHLGFTLPLVAPIVQWLGVVPSLFFIQSALSFLGIYLILAAVTSSLQTLVPDNTPVEYSTRIGTSFFLMIVWILANQSFRNSLVWDFREDTLGFFFASLFVFSVTRGFRWVRMLSLVGLLFTKEHIALILPFFAVAEYFVLGQKKFNDSTLVDAITPKRSNRQAITRFFFTVFLSLTVAYFNFKILLPKIHEHIAPTHEIVNRLPGLGKSPAEVIEHLLSQPWLILKILFSRLTEVSSLKYLFTLFLPVVAVVIAVEAQTRKNKKDDFAELAVDSSHRSAFDNTNNSPALGSTNHSTVVVLPPRRHLFWLIAVAPTVAINLLSAAPYQRSLQFHYELLALPFLFAASLPFLMQLTRQNLIACVLLAFAVSGRWPGHHIQKFWPTHEQITDSRWLAALELSSPSPTSPPASQPLLTSQLSPATPQPLLTASLRTAGQVSFCQNTRSIQPNLSASSVSGSEATLVKYSLIATPEAHLFLLDRESDDETRRQLQKNSASLIESSPSGRFELWQGSVTMPASSH